MLELRPVCEHCATRLAPDDTRAMICSYECTFCRDCVEQVLLNVCPNCGGGFVPRPVRPSREWREGTGILNSPASERRVHNPVDPQAHRAFAEPIRGIPPESR